MPTNPDATQDKLRKTLADGATAIAASERTSGLATLTFDELSQRYLEKINGSPRLPRPGKIERLTKTENTLDQLLEEVEQAAVDPPFLPQDETDVP